LWRPTVGLDARLVVYAHLHRPFVRRIGSLIVANTGSVGWPVDGDWRPSYLLIDDGEVWVRRVRYDVQAQIAELRASSYPSRSWLVKVPQRAESVRPLELDAPTTETKPRRLVARQWHEPGARSQRVQAAGLLVVADLGCWRWR
jgi:hypothetical protein